MSDLLIITVRLLLVVVTVRIFVLAFTSLFSARPLPVIQPMLRVRNGVITSDA